MASAVVYEGIGAIIYEDTPEITNVLVNADGSITKLDDLEPFTLTYQLGDTFLRRPGRIYQDEKGEIIVPIFSSRGPLRADL